MNLMDLFIKIGVDDQASSKIETLSSKLGNGLKKAAEIGVAAMTTAGAGIAALGKASIDAYADYEQLVGGVETLFKKSAPKVQKYASEAYKTAGLSANEYMETVTSFSASLLQSLEQDTEAAAEYADMAIRDMSDNANKMGTDMSMIQNAYQGFAKQNYTMLDNLKLGYGGTQEEMKRLIADAAELSDTVDAQSLAFDNVVKAIHVVQDELGITGTTAKEAGATISGSISSMKAAWENLVTGIADENADIGQLFDDLVVSVVGDGSESNKGVLGNLLPRIEQVFEGLGSLGEIVEPYIKNAANSVLSYFSEEFASGDALTTLTDGATSILTGLADAIPGAIDTIGGVGLDIVNGISNFISDEATLDKFLGSAGAVIKSLVDGLAEKGPELITGAAQIVTDLVTYMLEPERLEKFFFAAGDFLGKLAEGIGAAIPKLAESAEKIGYAIENAIMETDWIEVGKKIFNSVISGFAKGVGMKGTYFDDLEKEYQREAGEWLEYGSVGPDGKIVFNESAYESDKYYRKKLAAAKFQSAGLPNPFETVLGVFNENETEQEMAININIDGDTIASVTYDRYKNIIAQKGG